MGRPCLSRGHAGFNEDDRGASTGGGEADFDRGVEADFDGGVEADFDRVEADFDRVEADFDRVEADFDWGNPTGLVLLKRLGLSVKDPRPK